jgi:MSHA biogenesis protein MshG
MGNFHYRARDIKGQLRTGQIVAENLKSAKNQIAQKGLIVLSAKESPFLEFVGEIKERFRPRVSNDDMILFSRQMQIIYTVGIPILQGMQLILEQTTHPQLKQAIIEMTKDVAEGKGLHEAMSKHSRIFDPVYINLIRVGENTGGLTAMLDRASLLIEERSELAAKVNSATFYPRLVVGFFVVVLLTVVYGVLPRLKVFFTSLGADLPPITRIVMGTSDFFVKYWYIIALLVGFGIYAVRKVLSIPKWRLAFDRAIFRLPVFGLLFQQIEVNTFCIILDILLRSGVAIVEAFTYVEKSAGNTAFALDLANCRIRIEKGETLSQGLASATTFPSLIKGLIGMGEEGGQLPDVLQQISRYYKVQINHRLGNLAKLIEPVLLLFIFSLILVLALAVFMPMWKMSSALKR